MATESAQWKWVDDEDGLAEVARALSRADAIAVDTESDSMHSYFEKVCLMQFATRDEAFLVDPLALNGKLGMLAPVFADRNIAKILHGADYDIVCLKRDFSYDFRNVFDTMIAAQFLDLPKFGLADLVEKYFGESLDKKHSRTNWARRPLSESELVYSYLDVRFLIELRENLTHELESGDVLEEASMEFVRLEEREYNPREFDPDGYRKIRGSKDLADVEKAVLRELYLMRDRESRKVDRPPFKVVANDTMLRISRSRPRGRGNLRAIKGVSSFLMRRYGDKILEAVSRGVSQGRPPPPKRKQSTGHRLSPRQQRQLEQLREWRKARSQKLETPTLVILPNHAMLDVVVEGPRDLETLGGIRTVGKKRASLHGDEILGILHRRG